MFNNAFRMTIVLTKVIDTIDNIECKLAENRFKVSNYIRDTFTFTCLKQFSKYAIAGNEKMVTVYENSTVREINNLERFIDNGNEVPHFIWGEVGELMALLYELNELDSNS